MTVHLPQLARGVGVVTLTMRPMLVATASTLLGTHGEGRAELGGRLVEALHSDNLRPGAGEVKR